jgi:hypothetical protein
MFADGAEVMVAEPQLASAATAALASIRVQLGTAEQHLRQALERGARLRQRLARAGGTTEPAPHPALAEAEASIERARTALEALAR